MLDEDILSEAEIDWAVRRHRHFARELGWGRYYPEIFRLLGLGGTSARERHHFSTRRLVVLIAAWQGRHPPLEVDGILGPDTWIRMKPMLGRAPAAPVPASRDEAVGRLEARRESRVTEDMQIRLGQSPGRNRLADYTVEVLRQERAATRLVSSVLPFPTLPARGTGERWTNWCQLRIGALWMPVRLGPWRQEAGGGWRRDIAWREYEFVATETWLMRGYKSVALAPGWLYLSPTGRPTQVRPQTATGARQPARDHAAGAAVPGISRSEKLAWTAVAQLAGSTTKFVALGRGVAAPATGVRALEDLGSDGGQHLLDATIAAVMGAIAGDAFTDLVASSVWLVDIIPAPSGRPYIHRARHGS